MKKIPNWLAYVLAAAGAAAGGVVGYFGFIWLYGYNLYAIVLPGALVGLGCGLFLPRRSIPAGVACGIAALGLEVFIEWHFFPFIEDQSLRFFLGHLHDLLLAKLLMMAVGAAFAIWFGMGRAGGVLGRRQPAERP